MGRTLGYDDAVRLLGGDNANVHRVVDTLVGSAMLATVGPFREVLDWFDAKAELSRVTERLITGLIERRAGSSRQERAEQLRAAHVVLAAAAFFEVVDEATLPLSVADLRLTPAEQRALAERVVPRRDLAPPVPGPAESHEEFRGRLAEFYDGMAAAVVGMGEGLTVWEHVDPRVLYETRAAIRALAEPAVVRFEGMLGRLAAQFPEVAFWAGVREQTALHTRLRDVTTGLASLGEVLDSIAAGRAPDERRAGLARAYAAALSRSITATGEVPPGLCLPTLGEAFVPQLFRAAEVTAGARLNAESWWDRQPVRDDLLAFLTGRLTSPDLTAAPLVVLGQPGSGKSVLTRVLAARLPANDFLPVLVPLRSVHAAAEVQDQIEQAVRAATGERVDWPALARSAGDALPVVILDGFDELLQATAVSQTDYLMRVAAFQRREADQGRPVAVIVTSRISVADRAQTPDGAVAIRLEPFDETRIGSWVATWNRVNAAHFSGGPAELSLDAVLAHAELAGQPLLLLMLAVYDAEGNALRSAGTLRPDELYERLLQRFARRQVEKLGAGLPVRDQAKLVEAELRTLSVVAFAMVNRRAQWVTEAELDADLHALGSLIRPATTPAPGGDLRAPLRAAELALGSFFFVHRARSGELSAYEFLHATFGEYLVARLIHRVIRDMVARDRATEFTSGPDDGLLHALLSFAPLSTNRQILVFLRGLVSEATDEERADWTALLIRLFDAAQRPRGTSAFDAYVPREHTVQARIAAHTANLLVLMLCATDVHASSLLGRSSADDPLGRQTVRGWQDMALLWHSQGGLSGWVGLYTRIQVIRIRDGDRRDMLLSLALDGTATAPPVDAPWLIRSNQPSPWALDRRSAMEAVRLETHFTCDESDDFLQHAIEPLYRNGLMDLGDLIHLPADGTPVNVLGAVLELLNPRSVDGGTEVRLETAIRLASGVLRRWPGGSEVLTERAD